MCGPGFRLLPLCHNKILAGNGTGKIKTRPDELGQLESTILDKPESVGVKLDHVERPQSQLTAGRFARGKLLEEGDATPDEQSLQTQEF